jgi:hypothetical protein
MLETWPSAHDHPASAWKQVFVLSLPRSGSTLLRLLLDTHPAIACPGEMQLGRLCDALQHTLLYSLGQTVVGGDEGRGRWVARETQALIEGLLSRYLAAKGKAIWAEKTPANLEHAETLRAVFPQAAFICLYRHPLDTIRSGFESMRFGRLKYNLWDYRSGCEFYVEQTRRLLDFERKHAQCCLRVRYESLVSDAASSADALFSFLRLPWERDLLERVFTTAHDRGPGDPKAELATRIYADSLGRGAEVLPILKGLPASLREAIGALAVELGYPPVNFDAHPTTPESRQAPARAATVSSVEEFFRSYLPRRLEHSSGARRGLRGVVRFEVKGAGGGVWTVDLERTPALVVPEQRDADCVISVRSDDLLKLGNGELTVGECWLQAKLRLQGDEALAVSLGRTLFN